MFENYVYPPRPEKMFPASELSHFESMNMFIAQPKLNGSCCVAIVNGEKCNFYNRRKETFSKFVFSGNEMRNSFSERGLTIFCGEYLNKSQRDAKTENTNGRLVLFDIIWYAGKSLVGTKFDERQKLLRSLFTTTEYDKWIDRISDNLFIVKNFESNFDEIWKELIQQDVYEGLVLKKKRGLLRPGTSQQNNTDWQIKCRKPTKNYSF